MSDFENSKNKDNSKKLVEYFENNDPRQYEVESELLANPEGTQWITTEQGDYAVSSDGWSFPIINKIATD